MKYSAWNRDILQFHCERKQPNHHHYPHEETEAHTHVCARSHTHTRTGCRLICVRATARSHALLEVPGVGRRGAFRSVLHGRRGDAHMCARTRSSPGILPLTRVTTLPFAFYPFHIMLTCLAQCARLSRELRRQKPCWGWG